MKDDINEMLRAKMADDDAKMKRNAVLVIVACLACMALLIWGPQ